MRTLTFVLVLLFTPMVAAAQSDADLIEEALLPLPNQLREDAAVVVMGDNGQRRVHPRGKDGTHVFSLTRRGRILCELHQRKYRERHWCLHGSAGGGATIQEAWDVVNAAIEADSLTTATPGTLIFIQSGLSRAESAHLVVTLVPYATAEATGLGWSRHPTVRGSCARAPPAPTSCSDRYPTASIRMLGGSGVSYPDLLRS